MARLSISENGRTPSAYTHIQRIDSVDAPQASASSDQPPDFTAHEFPSLGVIAKKEAKKQAKAAKNQKKQNPQPAQSQPLVKPKKAEPKPKGKQNNNLSDLEDTETVLYKEVCRLVEAGFENIDFFFKKFYQLFNLN